VYGGVLKEIVLEPSTNTRNDHRVGKYKVQQICGPASHPRTSFPTFREKLYNVTGEDLALNKGTLSRYKNFIFSLEK
jgi:hypothetical protein